MKTIKATIFVMVLTMILVKVSEGTFLSIVFQYILALQVVGAIIHAVLWTIFCSRKAFWRLWLHKFEPDDHEVQNLMSRKIFDELKKRAREINENEQGSGGTKDLKGRQALQKLLTQANKARLAAGNWDIDWLLWTS